MPRVNNNVCQTAKFSSTKISSYICLMNAGLPLLGFFGGGGAVAWLADWELGKLSWMHLTESRAIPECEATRALNSFKKSSGGCSL